MCAGKLILTLLHPHVKKVRQRTERKKTRGTEERRVRHRKRRMLRRKRTRVMSRVRRGTKSLTKKKRRRLERKMEKRQIRKFKSECFKNNLLALQLKDVFSGALRDVCHIQTKQKVLEIRRQHVGE